MGRITAPKDIHALISATYEYITLPDKRGFADVSRWSWDGKIIPDDVGELNIIIRVFIRDREASEMWLMEGGDAEQPYRLNIYIYKLKFICWNLIPNVIAFRGGTFGRWLGQDGGAHVNGISVLKKDPRGSLVTFTIQGHEPGSRLSPDTILI